jgi:deoxyribodipyrimidine photolyase
VQHLHQSQPPIANCPHCSPFHSRVISQIKKFDKDLEYIKKWVPDFQELTYPDPMVDHKMARERCLETYKAALN